MKQRFLIFKSVLTWSEQEKKVRLFRITYARQKQQITFGLQPKLLSWEKKWGSFKMWVLGVVFHWHGGHGGLFPN